jgi:hypothetical protein
LQIAHIFKTKTKLVPQSEWRGEGNKFSVRNPAEEGAVYEAEIETLGDDLEVMRREKEEEEEEEEEEDEDDDE